MYHKFYIFIFSVIQGNGTWDSAVRAEMITATTLTLTVLITFSVSPWPTCGTASLDMVRCSRSINIYRTGCWASSWLLQSYCPSLDSSPSAENWPWVCWPWRFWQWACLEDSCWLSQHSTVFSWRTTALWSSRSRQKIWHKRWLARPWTSLRGRKCEMSNCHWLFFFKTIFSVSFCPGILQGLSFFSSLFSKCTQPYSHQRRSKGRANMASTEMLCTKWTGVWVGQHKRHLSVTVIKSNSQKYWSRPIPLKVFNHCALKKTKTFWVR